MNKIDLSQLPEEYKEISEQNSDDTNAIREFLKEKYPIQKISETELLEFSNEFYTGKYPHMRFGQAFMYKFQENWTLPIPELFYEEDDKEAWSYIFLNFVKEKGC